MRFQSHKRRSTPAIIIVSLIDVLMVVLIFLVVSTTFREHQLTIKLVLPESKQGSKKGGAGPAPVIVVVGREKPHIHIDSKPVNPQQLEAELTRRVQSSPQIALQIQADRDAPYGEIIRVWDAAKAAKVAHIESKVMPVGP